jgi:CDP-glucose 4,6-dehydratase
LGGRKSSLESVGSHMTDFSFYQNKKVLVTGHTGFKGSWLCQILSDLGAKVTGYALQPPTSPNLYSLLALDPKITSVVGDIRDYPHLKAVFNSAQPEIVFHMAAQPLVRKGYQQPVYTYEINVMGTVHLLECVRQSSCVQSLVNVTTDKVYENKEWVWGYRETDRLNGSDPYSNSKSCSELVTGGYSASFFQERPIALSTVRAGNVIGGGDFSQDRIVPDCIRAAMNGEPVLLRQPHSVRPYQHVLEPLFAYLEIAQKQYYNHDLAGQYNVGPAEEDCVTTAELASLFCKHWGEGMSWQTTQDSALREANFLKLDCSKLQSMLNWKPRWNIQQAVEKTVEWAKVFAKGGDVVHCTARQIREYLASGGETG